MLKLTKNKIAIQPRFDPDTSAGGIIIPDIAKERCDQGIVKYIGPEVEDVRIGDYVLFSGYDGLTMQIEGEGTLILLHEPFIKAIFKEITTPLTGLYFKERFDEEALDADIGHLLRTTFQALADVTDTKKPHIFDWYYPGFKSMFLKIMTSHYPYFNAPYEIAMQEIMAQFSSQPHFAKITNKEDDRSKTDHFINS